MGKASLLYSAFNYGYTSPKLRGRVDLDFYDQALDYLLNYKVSPQGELSFREGSVFVSATKGNKPARLISFLFNTEQAYIIELTDQYMRFYKDHGLITETPKAISAITQAANAQLTITGHGFIVGDPIYLDGIAGMSQLNGQEATIVTVPDANTVTINISTVLYSAYTAGGTAAKIYQIATPYTEAQLFEIDYTQTNNTMYLVHKSHAPRKLTRSGHTSWTLVSYDITANPFGTTFAATTAITAITVANPPQVTSTGHGLANGDIVYIESVAGMSQVNKRYFTIDIVDGNNFKLRDVDGTTYTTYTSGGTVKKVTAFSYPSVVTLFEQRLVFAASDAFPTRFWMSVPGSLDNFNTGTLAADAIIYTVAGDQANRIRWMVGSENFLAFGTSGSEYRISGGGDNDTIAPLNISVKPTSFNGVAAIRPIRLDSYILYIQRNGKTVRSYEYNALQDGYTSPDRTLLADHITRSKVKQMAYTAGTPNIVWAVLNNGRLLGLTFDPAQQVVAWHPHTTKGKYLSLATIPEANDDDELWTCVERTVGGVTKRYVEYMPNVPEIPVVEDYFTGIDNKEIDLDEFLTALWQVQKTLIHADSVLIYDGRDVANVSLTITGDMDINDIVTVTAGGAFFTAQMVGRRIQTPEGGQIEITAYTGATQVTGRVLYPIEALTFAAFEWFYMAIGITGASHMEGEEVAVLADGGIVAGKVVTNGSILFDEHAGYAIVGLGYVGMGKTGSVEVPLKLGTSQGKARTVTEVAAQMRASLGTKFGTSFYRVENPQYRQAQEVAGRPPRLFDANLPIPVSDGWNENKSVCWLHNTPTPSNIQLLAITAEATD